MMVLLLDFQISKTCEHLSIIKSVRGKKAFNTISQAYLQTPLHT